MAKDRLKRFYVYALLRENGTPFYIGKGTRNRWEHHETHAVAGRSHKDNIILRLQDDGIPLQKVKLADGLTTEEACAMEIELIARLGREPSGPLVNRTAGGDGLRSPSDEVRRKLSDQRRGRRHTPESRQRMSEAQKGKQYCLGHVPTKEHRKNISDGLKGHQRSAETREKMAAAQRGNQHFLGRSHSAESRLKLSELAKARPPMSDATRKKISAAHQGNTYRLGRKHSPETRMKISAAMRARAR